MILSNYYQDKTGGDLCGCGCTGDESNIFFACNKLSTTDKTLLDLSGIKIPYSSLVSRKSVKIEPEGKIDILNTKGLVIVPKDSKMFSISDLTKRSLSSIVSLTKEFETVGEKTTFSYTINVTNNETLIDEVQNQINQFGEFNKSVSGEVQTFDSELTTLSEIIFANGLYYKVTVQYNNITAGISSIELLNSFGTFIQGEIDGSSNYFMSSGINVYKSKIGMYFDINLEPNDYSIFNPNDKEIIVEIWEIN